jgi:hypothetical protein
MQMQFSQTLNGNNCNDISLTHKSHSQQTKNFPISVDNSNNYYYSCSQNPNLFQGK